MNDLEFFLDIIKNVAKVPHPVYSKELEDVRDYLVAKMLELGVETHTEEVELPNGKGDNIVGVIPSKNEPKRVLVLGAHYDSVPVAPGAKDNASGVAAILTLLKNIQNLDDIPEDLEMRFVLFTAEEIGTFGSRAYAKKLREENVNAISVISDVFAPDKEIPSNLICQVIDEEMSKPIIDAFNKALLNLGKEDTKQDDSKYWVPRVYGHSDHQSFYENGFAHANITIRGNRGNNARLFNGYHQPEDTFESLSNLDLIEEYFDVLFETVKQLIYR